MEQTHFDPQGPQSARLREKPANLGPQSARLQESQANHSPQSARLQEKPTDIDPQSARLREKPTTEPFDKRQMPIWHYRGKFPHREYKPLQFITYRLYDSVPQKVIDEWKEELKITDKTMSNDPEAQELRKRIDKYEDAGYGQCFLKDPRIASIVQENLLYFSGIRYNALNWCIMPNHVHVLIEVKEGWTLSTIMHGWRSYTAHQANKILGRKGDFWMDEYFDRYIRDENHLEAVANYIYDNPYKAGLIDESQIWPWSGSQSARL